MFAEICILQGQIHITQMCYKTPSIQTSFKNQWLISSMKRKPRVWSLLKHVPVVCEDQPFQQITLLWQNIPWSSQEVTADWMHFSSNSYFNFIHDSLFPQKNTRKGFAYPTSSFFFSTWKSKEPIHKLRNLTWDSIIEIFFEAREPSLSRVLQLVSDCQLDFERYCTSDNISC